MTLLESLKNLFGFTQPQPTPAATPAADPTAAVATMADPTVAPVAVTPMAPTAPKSAPSGPPPAARYRDQVLRFLVDKLRPYQNEPGAAPTALRLFVACASPEEEEVYRVALWDKQPGKFQAELSRQLADNYIKLAKDWQFAYTLSPAILPDGLYRDGNLGLQILDASTPDGPPQLARITALVGQTEQAEYRLDPAQKTNFCIGRGHTTQTTSGRVRTNDIVLLNDDDPGFDPQRGAGNGAVSRAHATLHYNAGLRRYALVVDPGGLPASGNKTKLMHPDDRIERADIPGMGYPLQHGDQIELGGAVTLLFEFTSL